MSINGTLLTLLFCIHFPRLGNGNVHFLCRELGDGVPTNAANPGDGASGMQHSLLSHLSAAHTIASKLSTLEHASAVKGLSVHFCFRSQQSLTKHAFPGQTIESNAAFFTLLSSQNDFSDSTCESRESKGGGAGLGPSSGGGDGERGTHCFTFRSHLHNLPLSPPRFSQLACLMIFICFLMLQRHQMSDPSVLPLRPLHMAGGATLRRNRRRVALPCSCINSTCMRDSSAALHVGASSQHSSTLHFAGLAASHSCVSKFSRFRFPSGHILSPASLHVAKLGCGGEDCVQHTLSKHFSASQTIVPKLLFFSMFGAAQAFNFVSF